MSRNLVEIVRRHHEVGAPTALAVLKEAMERRGEITDEDRRVAAERSGLPEAAVHGVSTFYDDLLAPRGARHVRVCTGTACFAATGGAHVDAVRADLGGRLALGERSADGAVSLAETVCLGFCHASPAIRDGDVIDAGPGVVDRVLAGATQPAVEPVPRSVLPGGPQLLATGGDWEGLGHALAPMTPEGLLAQVTDSEVRGRGGAGFPAGAKWAFARTAAGERKFIVANGDEGDPGSYIDKVLMESWPSLLVEGMALAGFAVGADHGFVLTRSEYPRSKPALEAAVCWPACRDCAARCPRGRRPAGRHPARLQVRSLPDRPAPRARDVRGRRACRPRQARGAARDARARLAVRPRRSDARPHSQPLGTLSRGTRTGMTSITIDIDGTPAQVAPGTTVLAAVRATGGVVPTLCFDERQEPYGACRVCLVGIEGLPGPAAACTTLCRDGMVVDTHDATARRVPAATVELVLSDLPQAPAPHTELAVTAAWFRLDHATLRWPGAQHALRHDERHPYLALQHELRISCGRCVRACDEVQGAACASTTT